MYLGRMWVVFLLQALLLWPQNAKGIIVKITNVESAVAKGGVCLDGSPPAYHMDKGFGAGINNWLIQLEGGGWCNNVTTCLARRTTRLGSSTKMATELAFSAILSSKPQFNPDFYNWNRVKVRYCDGASFTGDVEEVNPTTKLYYRGARLFRAVIEDLLAKGMNKAQNALLSGCSAGGLGAILNCDNFRALLPAGANVKCMSDAGYFINAKDIAGLERIQQFYDDVVSLHGSAKNLPSSCTSKMKPGLCFFPQNVVSGLRTPYFALNAAYDSWQIKNILAPGAADPHGHWHNCKIDIKKCDADQLETMHGFRQNFLQAFGAVGSSPARGFFINSCYAHCQSEQQMYWLTSTSPRLSNVPIWKAVGDWYFDRALAQKKGECPYPCDKTCINRIYEES